MSIIFQLFRADYLSQLDPTALDLLKQVVRRHFRADEFVDTTRNTILETSPLVEQGVVDQAIEHIRNRASAVFQQLQPQPPPPTIAPGPFDLTQPLFRQLFTAGDLNNRLTPHQSDILEMAISCEVTHFNGYVYLLTIKERADKTVMGSGLKIRPTDPDTVYSPFNQASPLYKLYNYNPPPP